MPLSAFFSSSSSSLLLRHTFDREPIFTVPFAEIDYWTRSSHLKNRDSMHACKVKYIYTWRLNWIHSLSPFVLFSSSSQEFSLDTTDRPARRPSPLSSHSFPPKLIPLSSLHACIPNSGIGRTEHFLAQKSIALLPRIVRGCNARKQWYLCVINGLSISLRLRGTLLGKQFVLLN